MVFCLFENGFTACKGSHFYPILRISERKKKGATSSTLLRSPHQWLQQGSLIETESGPDNARPYVQGG